jgi:hypothetical protein
MVVISLLKCRVLNAHPYEFRSAMNKLLAEKQVLRKNKRDAQKNLQIRRKKGDHIDKRKIVAERFHKKCLKKNLKIGKKEKKGTAKASRKKKRKTQFQKEIKIQV